jgi:hypothetical protein
MSYYLLGGTAPDHVEHSSWVIQILIGKSTRNVPAKIRERLRPLGRDPLGRLLQNSHKPTRGSFERRNLYRGPRHTSDSVIAVGDGAERKLPI